jgi:hypothetical protein
MKAGRLTIITGPQGSGKTRRLRAALESLCAEGEGIAALVQPDAGRRPDGLALAFDLELVSGAGGRLRVERLPLARELHAGEGGSELLVLGRFVFERSSFARAQAFLEEVRASDAPIDTLALDEIGRLELVRGEGLRACLDLCLGWAAGGATRLICCARLDCAQELSRIAEGGGFATTIFELPGGKVALESELPGHRRDT